MDPSSTILKRELRERHARPRGGGAPGLTRGTAVPGPLRARSSRVCAGRPRIEASSTWTVWATGLRAHPLERRRDLHPAAGVGRHHDVRAGGEHGARLALAELAGRLGVQQVVGTGAAAADLGLDQLAQLDAGDAAQQPARLVAHALGVREVARVLVGDRHRQRVPLRDRAQLVEQLGDVARLRGQRGRALGPARLVAQLVAVLLEVRPAAGGVHDDGVDAGPSKASMTRLAKASASCSRPACADSAPQQPCTCGTTTSQPSAASTRTVAALTSGKKVPWTQPVSSPTVRRRVPCAGVRAAASRLPSLGAQRLHRLQARGQPVQQTAAGEHPTQAARLVGAQRTAQRPQPPRVREEPVDRLAQQPLGARPLDPPLELRAGGLDELVVLHAGRARGHAGHAPEALVEVPDAARRRAARRRARPA